MTGSASMLLDLIPPLSTLGDDQIDARDSGASAASDNHHRRIDHAAPTARPPRPRGYLGRRQRQQLPPRRPVGDTTADLLDEPGRPNLSMTCRTLASRSAACHASDAAIADHHEPTRRHTPANQAPGPSSACGTTFAALQTFWSC